MRWRAEKALSEEYHRRPWPLSECRLNEWCFIINLDIARKISSPLGEGRPFGAYIPRHDTGVAWFRDVNHGGFRVAHMDITPYGIYHGIFRLRISLDGGVNPSWYIFPRKRDRRGSPCPAKAPQGAAVFNINTLQVGSGSAKNGAGTGWQMRVRRSIGTAILGHRGRE